jgi:hypothetical protein
LIVKAFTNYVYAELVGYRCRGAKVPPPALPDTCPVCGADVVFRTPGPLDRVVYRCGGGYLPKDQIQNHTDYWWGMCGGQGLKAGDRVRVFQKPLTDEQEEGVATLRRFVDRDESMGTERWLVKFDNEKALFPRAVRRGHRLR